LWPLGTGAAGISVFTLSVQLSGLKIPAQFQFGWLGVIGSIVFIAFAALFVPSVFL